MIICLKGISEEGFSFNSNIKIIHDRRKLLRKAPTQQVKFSLYENQISAL